ncbi:MAG: hypothetical protein NTX23_05900 [Candidatus Bipolaricaulota bacterium]|nr:hypothetical protein [Candidatus Bipolaricaulota bacterium]
MGRAAIRLDAGEGESAEPAPPDLRREALGDGKGRCVLFALREATLDQQKQACASGPGAAFGDLLEERDDRSGERVDVEWE